MTDTEKTVVNRLADVLGLDIEKVDRVQIMLSATMKIENLQATNRLLRAQLDEFEKLFKPEPEVAAEEKPFEFTPTVPVKHRRGKK